MKNEIIKNGVFDIYLERKKALFEKWKDIDNYKYYEDIMNEEYFKECKKINQNNIQRKYRTKERLLKWAFAINNLPMYKEYKIIFGTLTFNEDQLKLEKKTRRKYVERFLKEQSECYIANIDYGKINNREHYHFVAFSKNNINCKKWKAIINVKKVQVTEEDIEIESIAGILRIKNYLMKLNNHSYKESTKNEKLIQDRNRALEDIFKSKLYKEVYQKWKLNYA